MQTYTIIKENQPSDIFNETKTQKYQKKQQSRQYQNRIASNDESRNSIFFSIFNIYISSPKIRNFKLLLLFFFNRTMKLSPYAASSLHCSIKRELSIIGLIPRKQDWKFNRI